ncbi:MAG TPA: hypothetical protein VFI31_11640 [Pirellulales bacterium]|nr:hypothetical protein [Pirellulales bacterium]
MKPASLFAGLNLGQLLRRAANALGSIFGGTVLGGATPLFVTERDGGRSLQRPRESQPEIYGWARH